MATTFKLKPIASNMKKGKFNKDRRYVLPMSFASIYDLYIRSIIKVVLKIARDDAYTKGDQKQPIVKE